jgi:hypothetical protein
MAQVYTQLAEWHGRVAAGTRNNGAATGRYFRSPGDHNTAVVLDIIDVSLESAANESRTTTERLRLAYSATSLISWNKDVQAIGKL